MFVLQLANSGREITTKKILCIVGVAVLHLLTGGLHHFISHIMHGEGYPNEVGNESIYRTSLAWPLKYLK